MIIFASTGTVDVIGSSVNFEKTSTCYKSNILTGLQANVDKYTALACI